MKMLRSLQAFLILSLYFSQINAVYQENLVTRGLSTRLHVLDPPEDPSHKAAEDEWFEQRLDHFDALNTQKWMQRYFSRYNQSLTHLWQFFFKIPVKIF